MMLTTIYSRDDLRTVKGAWTAIISWALGPAPYMHSLSLEELDTIKAMKAVGEWTSVVRLGFGVRGRKLEE